jgi:asparagine synthase (glutamine-hydrolysing)
MCGIVGTNFNSNSFDKALELLNHRGPDNSGVLKYRDNCFSHARLSIIDLDSEANQPMEFDDIIITFNGEIYNYKELIKQESLSCKTKSDTEVLIRLYQKYGTEFLNMLNGMFSFTIYDKSRDRFFCARDRFGKKPFFYYFQNSKFIYASEIKSILEILGTTPQINQEAFSQYLTFWAPIANSTFYDGIFKLGGGEFIVVENGNLKKQKYYDINAFKTEYFDEREIVKDIEELMLDSVRLRLTSDVSVATLLSGGVDSSMTSALYSKISGKKIDTFSIGYAEHQKYSELEYAKAVSKHIGSNHHEIVMDKSDYEYALDNLLDYTDEPLADSACLPTYMLCKEINKAGIKVALSGEGSDEIFLGYDHYFKMFEYYESKPKPMWDFDMTKEWEFNRRATKKEHIYLGSGENFNEYQKELMLQNYKQKDFANEYFKTNYNHEKWVSYIDFKVWIEAVLMSKVDRMSMASSVELRSPFLDYKLVEYLFKVDPKIKRGNTNKYLLKQFSTKYLPKDIVHRRKKGFSSPFMEWLYDTQKDEVLNTVLRVNEKTQIFKKEYLLFLDEKARKMAFRQHLWNIYIFSRWFEKMYLY